LCFFGSVLIPIFAATLPASAATPNLDSTLENRYKARLAWRIAFTDDQNCVDLAQDDKIIQDDMQKYPDNNDLNSWYADTRDDSRVGNVLFKGAQGINDGKDHEVDCNTAADMNPVLKALGFDNGITDFNVFIFDCQKAFTTSGALTIDRTYCPVRDEFKSSDLGRQSLLIRRAVLAHARQKKSGLDGVDITKSAYPAEEIYWYAQTVLKYNSNGSTGCQPKYYTGSAEDTGNFKAATSSEFTTDSLKETFSPPLTIIDNTGKSSEVAHVMFKIPKDRSIEGLDTSMVANVDNTSPSRATCLNFVRALGKNSAAYQNALVATIKANTPGITADCASKSGNEFIACSIAAGVVTNPGGPPGDSEVTQDDFNIQCNISANPLTWFMCPLIDAFKTTVNVLDKEITKQLTIDTDAYLGDNTTGASFKLVWSNVRNIAMGLLVIMGLVMVISTAIGSGPFDAYTVKKIMPRILIALIGITLSWSLTKYAIDFTNSLGLGVRQLIQQPFMKAFQDNTVTIGQGQLSLGGLGTIGIGLGLGIWGVLSLAGTAALAVTIAIAILTFRQMLIILLVVLSPLAMVMYILPNTKKATDLWWSFFSKALLTFPIISGMIAIGRVFAVVGQNVNNGLLGGFISVVAYFGPYFLLPAAFRMAGGALGNLSGMVNNRGKGAFDRLSKFRQGKVKQNWENSLNQRRFNPNGRLSGLNRTTQFAALASSGKAGFNPVRMAGRAGAVREIGEMAEAEHLIRDNDEVKAIYNDDHLLTAASTMRGKDNIENYLRTQTGGRFGNLSSAEMSRTVAMVEAAQRAGSSGSIQAVAAIGHAASGTGGTAAELLSEADRASHGSQYLRNRIIAAQNSAAGNARRPDFTSVGHTEKEDLARQLSAGTLSEAQVESRMLQRALETSGAHAIVGAREEPFRNMMTQLGADYIDARDSGDIPRATELASQITSFRSAASSAPPENRASISNMLSAVGVDPGAKNNQGGDISTDEQLGQDIGRRAFLAGGGSSADQRGIQLAIQQSTGAVRSRAGLYDQGSGTLTAEQAELRRRMSGGNGPPP